MLKFALKNMLTKKVKMILIILSIVISASVAILAYNVAEQVNDGLINTTSTYDTIIGPSGSSTRREVVSSVANSLSSASTPAFVSAFMSVDFPAFV